METIGSDQAARGPGVWIVNADHWPRALLRAELIERGYDATGFETLQDAIATLERARSPRPSLIVVDLHEQPVDGALATRLALQQVPILAVTDSTHADARSLKVLAGVLRRPLTIGAIADAVARLTGVAGGAPVP